MKTESLEQLHVFRGRDEGVSVDQSRFPTSLNASGFLTIAPVLIAFILFCIPGAGWSEDKARNKDVKSWIDLGFREHKQTPEDDRVFAAQMFAGTLVELGKLEAVGRVVEESLPEREKYFVKMVVAVHQGLHDRLEKADRTIRELPPEQQQSAFALLVVRLAQANRLEEAEGVLQIVRSSELQRRTPLRAISKSLATGPSRSSMTNVANKPFRKFSRAFPNESKSNRNG